MFLEVGQSGSYFFDASAERKKDSDHNLNGKITRMIFGRTFEEATKMKAQSFSDEDVRIRDFIAWSIYKNREDGTIHNLYSDDEKKGAVLDEHVPPQEWLLDNTSEMILGYECFRATTSFRGRTWDVWYTPEIPSSDGPWKLYGCPGLILKAETAGSEAIFQAIGIEKLENHSIEIPVAPEVKKCNNLKQFYAFQKNASMYRLKGYMNSQGVLVAFPDPDYSPIQLETDLQ